MHIIATDKMIILPNVVYLWERQWSSSDSDGMVTQFIH